MIEEQPHDKSQNSEYVSQVFLLPSGIWQQSNLLNGHYFYQLSISEAAELIIFW